MAETTLTFDGTKGFQLAMTKDSDLQTYNLFLMLATLLRGAERSSAKLVFTVSVG